MTAKLWRRGLTLAVLSTAISAATAAAHASIAAEWQGTIANPPFLTLEQVARLRGQVGH